ncbi:hypothetical protein ACRW9N_08905 [Listeria aquatica]|uniref:Uncharacterized protein n=1 Tax=Listeria aquatica FSL S10-1188 TaxID=1265818 RepID=W7AYA0_9LIST|nr:hypothetical protein [Listeria aquatica]EUJ18220.1 hypothetical protein MAQA_10816 [Listeria aquatica FSL S10-1188]
MPLFDQLKNLAGDKLSEFLSGTGEQISESADEVTNQVEAGTDKVTETVEQVDPSEITGGLSDKVDEVKNSIGEQLGSPTDLLNNVKDFFGK